MKVIYWWKLSTDEIYVVMKVNIDKEVKRSDGLWRFACGDVFTLSLGPLEAKIHVLSDGLSEIDWKRLKE